MSNNEIETPMFHMIKYQDQYTIIAIEMNHRYCFNINKEWVSATVEEIDAHIQSDIDVAQVEKIKNIIQSANKRSIQLLLICYMAFKAVPDAFKSLVESIGQSIKLHTIANIEFVPMTTQGIKNNQSLSEKIWKTIYINKILKSINLPCIITDWSVVISPYRYIFTEDKHFDTSIRLLQLRKAIAQISDTTDNEIKVLSDHLNYSISQYNLNLPDICISFQLPQFAPFKCKSSTIDCAKDILKLISRLAHQGIINNNSEVDNIRYDTTLKQINFNSFDDAILSHAHTDSFGLNIEHITNTINTVYDKADSISTDHVHVFNCYVMYDVIRALISLQSTDKKIIKIITDANNIMSQIYHESPQFKHNNKLYSSIDQLYEKYFGQLEHSYTFSVYKNNDSAKLEFLANYMYQFDFNNKI